MFSKIHRKTVYWAVALLLVASAITVFRLPDAWPAWAGGACGGSPCYPSSVAPWTDKSSGDVIEPEHINNAWAEIRAVEDGLLYGLDHELRATGTNRLVVGNAGADATYKTDGWNVHFESYINGGNFDYHVRDSNGNLKLASLRVGYAEVSTNSGTNLYVSGDLTVQGSKSAVVDTPFGLRKLYAVESPEVIFADEGLGTLTNGEGRVDLDPIFLSAIEGDYMIQITPYGDASLYVSRVANNHFEVRARDGDPNVTFAWRLSAHRKGFAGTRMEEMPPRPTIEPPISPPTPTPRVPRPTPPRP